MTGFPQALASITWSELAVCLGPCGRRSGAGGSLWTGCKGLGRWVSYESFGSPMARMLMGLDLVHGGCHGDREPFWWFQGSEPLVAWAAGQQEREIAGSFSNAV